MVNRRKFSNSQKSTNFSYVFAFHQVEVEQVPFIFNPTIKHPFISCMFNSLCCDIAAHWKAIKIPV